MSNINFATQQLQNTLHTAQPAPDIQCRRRHSPQLGTRCDECIIASTVSAPVLEHRCLLPHRWMCHERRAGPRPSSDEQPGLASDATCESTQNLSLQEQRTHPVQNVPGTRSRPLCSERSGTRGQGRRVSVAASRMRRVLGPILTLTRRYTPPPLVRPPSLTCSQRAESSSLDLVSSGELKG